MVLNTHTGKWNELSTVSANHAFKKVYKTQSDDKYSRDSLMGNFIKRFKNNSLVDSTTRIPLNAFHSVI